LYDPRLNTPALSAEERQGLILKHLQQVHRLARKIHRRLPENVSLDDLVSTGILGLIAAIDRFDPHRHVQLGAYAEHKIKGEILDSLRRLDWAPRQQRRRAKQIQATIAAMEQRLHRSPTEREVATELKLPIERFRAWQVNSRGLNLRTLETVEFSDPKESPSAVVERSEMQRALAAAVSRLPMMHQTVLSMYYRDELKPREISRIIQLPEPRVYEIRMKAIRQLRAWMARLRPTHWRHHPPQGQV
jgi:RNA polymerase sigma factor for flagellar operon FliA